MYEKLRTETPEGYYIITDSAFPAQRELSKWIKKPVPKGTTLPTDRRERQALLAYQRALVSARQAVEWGMRQIQGAFGILRIPMECNDHDRRAMIIRVCLRLHQLRTRMIGLNEIRSVFIPQWIKGGRSFYDHFESMAFADIRKADRIGVYYGL